MFWVTVQPKYRNGIALRRTYRYTTTMPRQRTKGDPIQFRLDLQLDQAIRKEAARSKKSANEWVHDQLAAFAEKLIEKENGS